MHIWENKDFKETVDKARKRTKFLEAKDDIESIYLLEKEIDRYRSKINDLSKASIKKNIEIQKYEKLLSKANKEIKIQAQSVYFLNSDSLDNVKNLKI